MIPLGNMKLLNPTLASFQTSHLNLRKKLNEDSQDS